MKTVCALALSACLAGSIGVQAQNATSQDAILAMGAYVPTDDMPSSEQFYRTLFDRKPTIQLDGFIAFDIAEGWFAIVSRERYAPDAVPGTGAVPYLQSGNLVALQARISQAGGAVPEIIEEPGIHLLKISDPNGQLIEFFMLTSP